jgi:long-chain-fatty-acid--CoA ligase ACSBG
MGSVFGKYLPVGVYTTNGADACRYLADNSDAEVAVVEDQVQLQKYLEVWNQLPQLKYIVVYGEKPIDRSKIPSERQSAVLLWKEVIAIGQKYVPKTPAESLRTRQAEIKPGNVCTLVYTSGTTGPPKGVMLSHDNYTWVGRVTRKDYDLSADKNDRILSYLPLSHCAAQAPDIFVSLAGNIHVFFADASAL